MSITLSNNRKISNYRVKNLLKAEDKKEATQLRGIRGWLQNKLSPESGLRSLFGITEREKKLEGVWSELHKPQTNNATSNVNKIITFHNLYNLMDEETKAITEFKINVTNYGFTQRLNFIIEDKASNTNKPLTSFKHFPDDKQFVKDNETLKMSAIKGVDLLNLISSSDKNISILGNLYNRVTQLNSESNSADDLLNKVQEEISSNEECKAYLKNTNEQIYKDFERLLSIVIPKTDPYGKESNLLVQLQIAILGAKLPITSK